MAVSNSTKWTLGLMFAVAVIAVIVLLPPEPSNVVSPQSAEFRHEAREVYRFALQESCPPVKAYPRAVVLAKERRSLAEFEARHQESAIGAQLAIAREDKKLELGCSADEDRTFAKLHIMLAKRSITDGLTKLDELGQRIQGGRSFQPDPSRRAAQFRQLAREAVSAADPVCSVSTLADNDTVLGNVQRELAAFRDGLGNTARATDFDVAESDVLYRDSITMYECADPGAEPVDQLKAQELSAMHERIAKLKKLL